MAVLTAGAGPDILFLSSSNLHSWTSTDLPYECMSITVYQSKLVLVGEYNRSTRAATNQLLTSTTGRQWKSSLPPMPTKRYWSSVVSTRSPKVLVVAGGLGSNHEDLDVIEVLQGNEWLVVDSLPVPAGEMISTLHDGKLCFMRRGDQDSTVFTCSCTSLISSCSKSSGKSSTDRPLWRHFQGPGGGRGTTIVSCSSRLVFIDDRGRVRVRGYSSMTRLWLTASTGPTPDVDGVTVATVLNTQEPILAHHCAGVYRGTVSGEREH